MKKRRRRRVRRAALSRARGRVDMRDDDASDARPTRVLGHAVFRVLCAETRVGGLIGRSGARVKKIVADTGAQVKVLESTASCHERAVLVFAPRNAEDDATACAAREAARRVVRFLTTSRGGDELGEDAPVSDDDDEEVTEEEDRGDASRSEASGEVVDARPSVTVRLLVPAGQAGHLIGKGGENIQEVRRLANGAHVAVQEVGQVPPCATSEDRVVEIHGKPRDVRIAADAVFASLKDYLVDSSVLGYYQPTVSAPMDPTAEFAAAAAMGMLHAPVQGGPMGVSGVPMGMQPPPVMVPMMPMMPPHAGDQAPLIRATLEVEGEKVSNVLGENGVNISAIAQISGCQVSLIETDSETKQSEVELQGPHESNIAAAKSLVRAFADGEMTSPQAFGQPIYPSYEGYPPMPMVFQPFT